MAHHAEPMDIDDESDFDNKENTYQHANVLRRSPCTEKGYEELDVSELNMKLRYSITPVASPMSKSMSHCLDNRYNTSTDESLNNTIINEYENNLTRSLNSTLNKTEIKSQKVLPLQSLPTDSISSYGDSIGTSRGTSVLRPLESTETGNDITITVSNENDIDNLSFPSTSSSLAHTPEATTPTKEIVKHDGGSPIMRGLKSVLNIFRSSQSPIPPGDEESKTAGATVTPVDALLPQCKPHAIASTPKNENIKETSLSRRNSPLKESLVFNEDLEKELQWSDDSTIVFSSEKIPIRKLFFQEKSKPSSSNDNAKNQDANSTVEYMDVSYNDLSMRDATLNGSVNKSKVNELPESDGEFVDCESTFTHNKVDPCTEALNEATNNQQVSIPEQDLVDNNAVINRNINNNPCNLDTTKDILNLLDSSKTVEGDLEKSLDISTTDIVNQLSDLINEEIVESAVTLVKNIDTKESKLGDVPKKNIAQLECMQHQVTSPVKTVIMGSHSSVSVAEEVSLKTDNLGNTVGIGIDSDAITVDLSIETKMSSAPVDASIHKTSEVPSSPKYKEIDLTAKSTTNVIVSYPSPVDIPLPNEDDLNEINDKLSVGAVYVDLQGNSMPIPSTSQNVLMAALDKSATIPPHNKSSQEELQNEIHTCPPSILSSDVPLLNTADPIPSNTLTHESMTDVNVAVQSVTIKESDLNYTHISTSKVDLLNEVVNDSMTKAVDVGYAEIEPEVFKTDISSISVSNMPLPAVVDPVEADNLPQVTVSIGPELVQDNILEKPDNLIEMNPSQDLNNEASIIKTEETISDEVKYSKLDVISAPPANFIIPDNEEHMEVSFVEPTTDKLSDGLSMDVSMVDARLEHIINPTEMCQSETVLPDVMSELPENITSIVKTNSADIVTAENSSPAHVHISENSEIRAEITTDEIANNNIVLEPMSITITGKDLTMNNTSKCLDTSNEHVHISAELNPCNDAKPILNHNLEAISSCIPQTCEKTTLPDISTLENIANAVIKKNETIDFSKVNEVTEGVEDIVSAIKTINTSTGLPSKREQDEVCKENAEYQNKDTTPVQQNPNDSDIIISLDSNRSAEIAPRNEEKMDEEVVVSESNSPFVSMLAEEVFDPDLEKEEIEEVESAISIKPPETASPPSSPKTVSKGYNFNFDDIDSINPFATKTKIRMSPPPGPSPNAALATKNMNMTEIVEPLKSDNNINRRKSMPERKKPLKAKRHLNSTFDGTENSSSKPSVSKDGEVKIDSKTESKEQVVATQYPTPGINQSDSNSVASPTQNVNHNKLDISLSPAPSVQGEKAEHKLKPEAFVIPSEEDTSLKVIDDPNAPLKNETKKFENEVMSDGSKPDTTSSSEQSTYFSVGASSNELTESKNVFNLPELDDVNPFATKSNIRQSPSRELDIDNLFATKSKIKSSPETSIVIPQQDPNCTVVIDNMNESKGATHNVSTCSGLSKTSDETNLTVREIHTEDEDTIEGPFLEVDDGNDDDKVPEFADNEVDSVEFANLNPQENEEAAEMFIDAEAFEFLMNKNKSDEVAYSGKESLFLKFDPLFARRVTSEGVSAALNEIKRKQSTPKKTPKQTPVKDIEPFGIPLAGPTDLNITSGLEQSVVTREVQEKSDDVNLTASKPMMAVTPAVNPVATPRKPLTPNKSNRLSMTFTSPAMAVIDRLLSLSSYSPSPGLDTSVAHVDRTHSEADQALTQLRELLAEKEIHVYNLRCESKELKDRLSTLETQMKTLEAESEERLKKVNDLNENLAEKTKMNRNMAAVVEEYERTIASLISETEQDKKRFAEERNELVRERDEQTAHLASMEVSFNDLHSKYEKSKQVIIGYKTNEELYKKSIQDFEENLSKMHANYELLKQHATSKLNHANQELEKINKAHEAEVLKFNAMIKRKELHITSLEESLTQKTKANEELTAICDELINKVG